MGRVRNSFSEWAYGAVAVMDGRSDDRVSWQVNVEYMMHR